MAGACTASPNPSRHERRRTAPARHRDRLGAGLPRARRPTDARRRGGSVSCSTGGTRIRSSTAPRWPRGSASPPRRERGSCACRSSRCRRTSRSPRRGPRAAGAEPEPLPGGPTYDFAAELAADVGVPVHASLYERADDGGLGFNTAICVAPDGTLLARTRKTHLPITAGYYEDRYFRPGDSGYPVVDVADARFGFPTCWDEWFPEVARAYSLHEAEVLVYPTAIGSEPDHPDFDTEPLWEQVIRAHGITNGLFIVVPNRIGTEGPITFYGSSFVSDPYGRLLVQAPRDEPAVLVADLDLDQRRDWLALFPFLATRRPDTYGGLVQGGP